MRRSRRGTEVAVGDVDGLKASELIVVGSVALINVGKAGAFIIKDKQEKYLQVLADPKRRHEILNRFNRILDFAPRFATLVPKELRAADKIVRLLNEKEATQSYHVMAKSLATDGEDSPLREALTQVIAHDSGSVLCCLPGRLAFHKAEAIEGAWYIFERKQEPAARL